MEHNQEELDKAVSVLEKILEDMNRNKEYLDINKEYDKDYIKENSYGCPLQPIPNVIQ